MKTRLLHQETAEEMIVGELYKTADNEAVYLVDHHYKPAPLTGRVLVRHVGSTINEEYYPAVIGAKIVLVDENKLTAKQVARLAEYCENVCQLVQDHEPLTLSPLTDEMGSWEKLLKKLIDGDSELPNYDDEKVGEWVESFTSYWAQ